MTIYDSTHIDLHCHSTASDGVLSPEQLVARAQANKVQVLALTDHDVISGLSAAKIAAQQAGILFVPGVEISVTWANHTIHIVGLNFDPDNQVLQQGLAQTRSGRYQRAQKIAQSLALVGVPNALEGALKYAHNPDLISRSHFARYMVELGMAKDPGQIFNRYLVKGKPGYVPMTWARLLDSVEWITQAGGRAVIAHPGRYGLNDLEQDALMTQFFECGGHGIEVITGSHAPDQYATYAKLAQYYGCLVSAGSDFHGPSEGRMDLGCVPATPKGLTPVWHDWF